jgi:hypothetical protein
MQVLLTQLLDPVIAKCSNILQYISLTLVTCLEKTYRETNTLAYFVTLSMEQSISDTNAGKQLF